MLRLQDELRTGTWQPGAYYNFRIRDPKPRLISAAPFRDRVVHHAVVNVLEPLFERRFIHDSYACRKGKGTHRAWRRAQYFLRRYPFYLKTDIVKFFPNVDHAIIEQQFARTIADQRLLDLIHVILASGDGILDSESSQHWFPGDDLFAVLRPKGLPIGNLTSQFFANVLLNPIDHFIKERLRAPGYVRYADDLVLFGGDKDGLWRLRDGLADELAKMRLKLHPDKTIVAPACRRLNFLGLRLFPDSRRMQQRTIQRLVRRRRRLQREFGDREIDSLDINRSLAAWQAFANDANSAGLIRDLWKQMRFRRNRKK
ncbi:MAG: reverse transcriptase/maturase family protein [Planctomycetota bacterium]|nr:reverse transcriptase/maturase family protein [Planctomycetota bacterium]